MLVLAPAACIMSGIALSQAFEVFTRSIKFQMPGEALSTQEVSKLYSCDVSYIYVLSFFSFLIRPLKWY